MPRIIPSALSVHRCALRLLGIVHAEKPLNEPLIVLYDKRRQLPPYAKSFCEMLAQHVKRTFPV